LSQKTGEVNMFFNFQNKISFSFNTFNHWKLSILRSLKSDNKFNCIFELSENKNSSIIKSVSQYGHTSTSHGQII
jgi:hypothetical protein